VHQFAKNTHIHKRLSLHYKPSDFSPRLMTSPHAYSEALSPKFPHAVL